MRKAMQKIITILIVILIIFNYIYSNYVPVYASGDSFGLDKVVNLVVNLLGGIVGIGTYIIRLPAMAIALAANILTAQVAYMDGATAGNESILGRVTITPFEIFFNKIQILDVNFLDLNTGGTTETIRLAVSKWYYIVRLISIAILLLILLYVGIRMAISSVASEKAAYKRALVDWIVSLALVFVLQYIIMFTVNANTAIVKALETVVINDGGDKGITEIMDGVSQAISSIALLSLGMSWEAMAATVVYCIIVFQTFVFLIKYIKRMLTVGFLIIISPLISITYSIDKMGDQKAQALNNWLKEFIYNILIQPFHCILYCAFIDTAFKLLARGEDGLLATVWAALPVSMQPGIANGVLAIVCILFLDTGEKIVRKIFGFEQASSLSALGTAAMAGAAVKAGSGAVGAAKGLRKGINFAKEKGLVGSLKKDFKNLAIAKQTRKNEKAGMSKEDAKQSAIQQVEQRAAEKKAKKATRSNSISRLPGIRKIKSAMDNRKESKIEAQMAKMLGGKENLEKFRNSAKNGEWNKKYNEAKEVVDKNSNRGRKIIKSVGNVAGKVWNSETGKYYRKRALAGGVSLVLGSMALAAGGPIAAFGTAKAGYTAMNEFNSTSTKNIAKEGVKYVEKLGITNDNELTKVSQKGDNKDYEANSEETKKLLAELKSVLKSMGQENKTEQITARISKGLLENPETFDLNDVLTRVLGHQNASDPRLDKAAGNFATHKAEGYLYAQINKHEMMGGSLDKLFDRMLNSAQYTDSNLKQYSTAELSNNENSDNSSPEGGSTRVDINKTVENIQKSEEIQEIINRGDTTEIELLSKKIDEQLQELKKINIEEQTKDVKDQISMLEHAKEQIALKQPVTNNSEGE